jgi:hypothetical protein
VSEALESTVWIHRELAVKVKQSFADVGPSLSAARKLEVFHEYKLGGRKAVVDFCHR